MTNNAADALKSALEKNSVLVAEIDEMNRSSESNNRALSQLELTCDLGDEHSLAAIGQLQVLSRLLPIRLAACEQALAEQKAEIVAAANNFIQEGLNPKIRKLIERAENNASAGLKSLYKDKKDLDFAIRKSDLVFELTNLLNNSMVHQNPIGGPLQFAKGRLEMWDRVCAIELKLS